MKSILTLVGGSDRDQVISQTAFLAAQSLAAHLHFLHIHVGPGEAARYSHAEFVRGEALRNCLDELQRKAQTFSKLAAAHVHEFCAREGIEMSNSPANPRNVTAHFREEADNPLDRLTFHAQHSDLVVMGRARQAQGLPPNTLERLIMKSGRPILLAASEVPPNLCGTVMVCWKESESAAHAVAAAMPILTKAKRVVFTTIAERGEKLDGTVTDIIAHRVAWNGVETEVQVIPGKGRAIADVLSAAAADCNADLVVMGAYGHSRLRELLLGSHTEDLVCRADRPIMLMH